MKAERRTTAPGTARKPAARNLRFVPAQEFGIDLVPPHRAAGRAFDQLHVVQAEGQQHGLLQPLMHLPFAADLLGDAQAAGIQPVQRVLHRVAHRALGRDAQRVALCPRRRSMVSARSLMSDPDGVQKCGQIVGLMIDMVRSRNRKFAGPAATRPSRCSSHTVVMPSACAGTRLRAISSNIAARVRHDVALATTRSHRRPDRAWARSPMVRMSQTSSNSAVEPEAVQHARGMVAAAIGEDKAPAGQPRERRVQRGIGRKRREIDVVDVRRDNRSGIDAVQRDQPVQVVPWSR